MLKQGPSLSQYAMRMIEFYDAPTVSDAVRDFAILVESGVEPEHAFHLVTQKARG